MKQIEIAAMGIFCSTLIILTVVISEAVKVIAVTNAV